MSLQKSNIGFIQKANEVIQKIKTAEGTLDIANTFIDKIDKICNDPLNLAVMGEFNAGKSSFINKLLGFDILPTGIVPKTATIIKVKYGLKSKIEIHYTKNGQKIIEESNDLKRIKEFQHAKDINNEDITTQISLIDEIVIYNNNSLLKNFTFIDTPGFNHDNKMDTITRSIFKDVDIAIWLITKNQAFKKTEIEEITRLKKYVDNILLVVNKADINDEMEEEEEIKQIINKNLSNTIINCNSIYFISSKKKTNEQLEIKFNSFLNELKYTALENDVRISEDLLRKEFQLFIDRLDEILQQWNLVNSNLEHIIDNADSNLDFNKILHHLQPVLENDLNLFIIEVRAINTKYKKIEKYSKEYIFYEFFNTRIKKNLLEIHSHFIQTYSDEIFRNIQKNLFNEVLNHFVEKKNIIMAIEMIKDGILDNAFLPLALLTRIKYFCINNLLNKSILGNFVKKSIDIKDLQTIIQEYETDLRQTENVILYNKYITKQIENIIKMSQFKIEQIKILKEIIRANYHENRRKIN